MRLLALAVGAAFAVSLAVAVSPNLESCPETGAAFDYSYYSCVNETHIEKKEGTCSGSAGNPSNEENIAFACSDFHEIDNLNPFQPELNTCITCEDSGKAACVSNPSEKVEVCEFVQTGLTGPFFAGNLKVNSNRCESITIKSEASQYKYGLNSWGLTSLSTSCPVDTNKYCVECENSMQLCSSVNATCTEIFEGFPTSSPTYESPAPSTSPTSEAIMVHYKSTITTYILFAFATHSFFLAVMF